VLASRVHNTFSSGFRGVSVESIASAENGTHRRFGDGAQVTRSESLFGGTSVPCVVCTELFRTKVRPDKRCHDQVPSL
jgi:hypothetical protein